MGIRVPLYGALDVAVGPVWVKSVGSVGMVCDG
jgi:hypothetical protein